MRRHGLAFWTQVSPPCPVASCQDPGSGLMAWPLTTASRAPKRPLWHCVGLCCCEVGTHLACLIPSPLLPHRTICLLLICL